MKLLLLALTLGLSTPAYAIDGECTRQVPSGIWLCPAESTDWYDSYTQLVSSVNSMFNTAFSSSYTITGFLYVPNSSVTASGFFGDGSAITGIVTGSLEDGSITTPKLAAGSVTSGKVGDGEITTAKLGSGVVTTSKLNSGAIIARHYGANSIGSTAVNFDYAGSASEGGPATTAIALNANPTACTNQFPRDTDADGTLVCESIVDADVPDTITISNLSGTNSGDQTFTASGDATASGSTSDLALTIAAGVVTTAKLGDGSVTSSKINQGAVGVGDYQDNSISATALAFNYAGSASEGGSATTALALDANPSACSSQFVTDTDADGTLTCASVTEGTLGSASVTTAKLADGAVTTSKILSGAVSRDDYQANSIPAAAVDFTYAGSASEAGPATTALALDANPSDCANNEFADEIAADGDLTCKAIADADVPDTITITNLSGTNTGDQTISLTGPVTGSGTGSFATTITAASVTTAKLGDGAVTTSKLMDDSVTRSALSADGCSDGESLILTGSAWTCTTASIADGSVTTDKLGSGAVTRSKILADAVSTVQIVDSAITTAKLASGSVDGHLTGTGVGSIIVGIGASANQINDIVLGYAASGIGLSAAHRDKVVIGAGAQATTIYSIAIGTSAAATVGNAGIAIGFDSWTQGTDAIAIGSIALAEDESDIAIGDAASTEGIGTDKIAIGEGALAKDTAATAIGDGAVAEDISDVAIGNAATTAGAGTDKIAIGEGALAQNTAATAIGDGAVAQDASDIALGFVATTAGTGTDKIAIGEGAVASADGAIAMGDLASSSGQSTIALGDASIAVETNDIAIGFAARAVGISGAHRDKVVIGGGAQATTIYSIAIGTSAMAVTGNAGIAIGFDSGTEGTDAIAIGSIALAEDDSDIAIGDGATTTGTGTDKIAIGEGAAASVDGAIAIGDGAVNARADSVVFAATILRITPLATAPAACTIGDFYVDTSGAYCGCAITNTWEKMNVTTGTCS